jgi:hypothetical protein
MRRKYLIGYPLWNCVDMVQWILEGCATLDKSRSFFVFLFSNCPQETKDNFKKHLGMLEGFEVAALSTDADLREGQNHNILMDYFMSTDADVLICPQDDNRFNSGRVLDDLDRLLDSYGDQAGIIGFRDGYDFFHQNIIGSAWSKSDIRKNTIPEGEWVDRKMVNTGPWAYTRHTVATIGKNDPSLPLFGFEDLCLRCVHAGKVNVCMGTDMQHEKFGRMRPADYGSHMAIPDLQRLRDRWGPITGSNIHG